MRVSSFVCRPSWVVAGLFLLLTCSFRLPAEEGPFAHIVRSLRGFYAESLPEKAYLHLDRSRYASGETIWFEAYVVAADSHQLDTLSKVLYVDLLTARQQPVARCTLRLRGGRAPGDLALPDTLQPGTYQLRAYTSWMRNAGAGFLFTRPLAVIGATSPGPVAGPGAGIDVQFFPEGGRFVEGLESLVGFKAVDEHGRGVAVQGTVLDAQRQVVVSFSSRHLGMGSFGFTPAPGQQYRAVVALPGGRSAEYPLPASQPTGYALRVSETPDDFVVVLRQRLPAGTAPAGPAILLAQVRGQVVYAAQAPISSGAPLATKVPKAKFPPGLVQFTLFDEQGTAQCERLMLMPNPPGVRLALVPDKPSYGPREAVQLRLAATDAAGQPVRGHFSVAVAAQSTTDADGPTLVSQLLLSSDLAGEVEDPGYYFHEPQTPELKAALNDLLLTQGWRRFVWKELLAGELPGRAFALEQGLGVRGQVLTAAGHPAAGRQVAYLQTNPTREAQMLTDATGHFLFYGIDGLDTTHVLLRAKPLKGEQALRLRLLAPPAGTGPLPAAAASATPADLADYTRRSQQQRALAQHYRPEANSILLSSVNVRGQPTTAPTDGNARPYSTSNAVVLHVGELGKRGDSRTLLQYLQGRVSGVTVWNKNINIRQAGSIQDQGAVENKDPNAFKLREPLYLIDGAIVSADYFISYPIRDIETIDILKQSASTLFGTQGAAGVIAAYTRHSLTVDEPDPRAAFAARTGTLSLPVPGYYRAREFYAPRYPAAPTAPPDPRYTTLYWAPEVATDTNGQAQLSFFTSDATGTFQVVVEGIGVAGTALRGTTTLAVKAK
jgi:hypothetical protein